MSCQLDLLPFYSLELASGTEGEGEEEDIRVVNWKSLNLNVNDSEGF